MKKFKEIVLFMTIAYISCVIVKIIMNNLSFNIEILRDSIFNAIGVTLGWYSYDYIHQRNFNKKK